MSHVRCARCGSRDHVAGYGFAGGVLGTYTMCADCSAVLDLLADVEGLDEEASARAQQAAAEICKGAIDDG